MQRFAPSLNDQQALAVDNILSADSWESTQRLLQPVRKAMAGKAGEHQPKVKKRKKGQPKAKKAVSTTSSSASTNRPSLAGQDTEAVVLATNSRSATAVRARRRRRTPISISKLQHNLPTRATTTLWMWSPLRRPHQPAPHHHPLRKLLNTIYVPSRR